MNRTFCCLALIALLPLAGQAATIYRCDVAGVPTFQDSPCAATAGASSELSPKIQLLQERRNRLLQRRRALMVQLLELQSQTPDETGAVDSPASGEGGYAQQAERQRRQWEHQSRLELARQRLGQLDDNLRLLDERIARTAAP